MYLPAVIYLLCVSQVTDSSQTRQTTEGEQVNYEISVRAANVVSLYEDFSTQQTVLEVLYYHEMNSLFPSISFCGRYGLVTPS